MSDNEPELPLHRPKTEERPVCTQQAAAIKQLVPFLSGLHNVVSVGSAY